MTTTIYLLRHGAYENPRRILHLRLPGFPLSFKGKKQAQRLASYLSKKPITAVYSSRLDRARETAEIIAKKFRLPVITDRRLLDVRSPLQGKPVAYIKEIDVDFYHEDFIRAGGERLTHVYRRMDQFIRAKAKEHKGQSIVVVSHGDPIMIIYTKYSGKPFPKAFSITKWYVPMASGFRITFDHKNHLVTMTKLPFPPENSS
jgi:broad specificity phosphatase PhoE